MAGLRWPPRWTMFELRPMLMELNVWGGIGVLVGAFGGLCPGIAGAIVCFIAYILRD